MNKISCLSVVFILVCLSSVSCVSEQIRQEIEGLREVSHEYLEIQWGQADEESQNNGGQRVLIYKNVQASKEDPLSGDILKAMCDMELILTTDNIVEDWKYLQCSKYEK